MSPETVIDTSQGASPSLAPPFPIRTHNYGALTVKA